MATQVGSGSATTGKQVATVAKTNTPVVNIGSTPSQPKSSPGYDIVNGKPVYNPLTATGAVGDAARAAAAMKATYPNPNGGQTNGAQPGTAFAPPVVAANNTTAPSYVQRAPATVPTSTNPVTTIGGGGTSGTDFSKMDDRQKMVQIGVDLSNKKTLTDEQKAFYIDQTMPKPETVNPAQGAVDTVNAQAQAEADRLASTKTTQDATTQAQIDAEDKRLTEQLNQNIVAREKSGAEQGQAVQSALSFSGFGRSTYNADKQSEVAKATADAETLLRNAKDAELTKYKMELQGADAKTLEGIQQNINSLKSKAADLQATGAAQMADLNAKNKVNAADSIANIMKVLSPAVTDKVNVPVSNTIGDGYLYGTDKNGHVIQMLDANGDPIKANNQPLSPEEKALADKRKNAINEFNAIRKAFVEKGITLNAESGTKFMNLLQTSDNPDQVLADYYSAASQNPEVIARYGPKAAKGAKAAATPADLEAAARARAKGTYEGKVEGGYAPPTGKNTGTP